ncbi:TVP38/TMEM64 family protein [Hutsoniella sourekii]
MKNTLSRLVNILTLVGIVVTIWACIHFYRMGIFTSQEKLESYMSSLGMAAPLVFFMISFVQVVLPIIPGALTIPVGAILFGARLGFFLNYSSICLGSLVNFLLARKYGTTVVRSIVGDRQFAKGLAWLYKDNFKWAFASAMVFPVAPDDLLCYIAGLSNVQFKFFFWTIILSKPWTLFVYTIGTSWLMSYLFKWMGG